MNKNDIIRKAERISKEKLERLKERKRREMYQYNAQMQKQKQQSRNSSVDKQPPQQAQPPQQIEQVEIIDKPDFSRSALNEKITISTIDNRCKYWMQQRLNELLNNDNLTSKFGLTVSITTDPKSGGYCIEFNKNGQNIARLNENGTLYCSNVFINGQNVLGLFKSSFNSINEIADDYVTNKDLHNGTYNLNVNDVITATATVNTINGCVISDSTDVLPCIPYIKTNKTIELGDTIDLKYISTDDYTVRLQASQQGTFRVSNSKGAIDAFDVFSDSNDRVEFHLGKSNAALNCAIIQYDVNPKSLGFGFYNNNALMTLDTNGNLSIIGAINGAIVGPIDSSITPTVPYIPVVKTVDNAISIGRRIDFHYNLGGAEDYTTRLECEGDGAIRISNTGNTNHPLRVMSGNSSSVQIQLGTRTGYTNDCAIIQYNLSGPTLGFGFWNGNNKVTIDPSGNLSTSGSLTTSKNVSVGVDLTVSGDTTINTLNVSSNANVQGNLDVLGNATVDILGVSSNASVLGNLDVLGSLNVNSLTNSMKVLILRLMYPVGSVYMSATTHDNPNVIFGVNIGTWTEITNDRYLLASDSYQTLREEGGSLSHNHTTSGHTLTIDEIPAHYHNILGSKNNNPGTNPSDCVPIMNYGTVSEYWERNNYNNTYIDGTGGGQAHNHGDTTTELVMPPYYRVHAWYRSA